MTQFGAWTFGTLLIVGLLTTAGVIGSLHPLAEHDSIDTRTENDLADVSADMEPTEGHQVDGRLFAQMENTTDESAPPGGFISSIVRMERSSVDAGITVEYFNTQLATAGTEADRAEVIASSLNASRQRVMMLENNLETLEAKKMNGSINQGWFDIELSWLLAAAENQEQVLMRLERAAQTSSQEELAQRNATIESINQIQNRVGRLLDKDNPDIHQTTFDRQFYKELSSFSERFNEDTRTGESGELDDLFDGEWVNLHIESDRGPTAVLSFLATDNTRIVDIRAGQHPDASVRMVMDERTARELITSESPGLAFTTAVQEEEITYSEIGS